MITKISDKGITFIKDFEGVRLKAYRDVKGVLTIGIGHTKAVYKDMVCTKAEALKWLKTDANKVARYINSLDMNINQEQFDALVCFGFNVGTGNLKRSTLLTLVKHSAPVENVAKEFYKWIRFGGKVLAGLVLRREGEAMLYGDDKYASKEDAMVHIEKRIGKHWRQALGC